MVDLKKYVENANIALQLLLEDSTNTGLAEGIQLYLNGGANKALRDNNAITTLRDLGIFFTGPRIAKNLINLRRTEINKSKVFYDPCCGVGDLLLVASQNFPIQPTLKATLADWGERLLGNDQVYDFVDLAKIRIIMSAIQRGARPNISIKDAKQYLRNISDADTLSNDFKYPKADIVLLNPPYTKVVSTENNSWSTGSVSQAAIYLERVISKSSPGATILAVLPDVLRAGSRYEKWRKEINKAGAPKQIKIMGRFDEYTDVDVFIGEFIVGNIQEKKIWWTSFKKKNTPTLLGELFHVAVGPVVPHRDPEDGMEYSYVTAKDVKLWTKESAPKKRRYSGTVFTPPFVVVKRTSSPSDKYRAGASIIVGKQDVAIENHLIVLSPKDGLITTCEKALASLKKPDTNDWLNKRIRCRHLTVSAVKELPCWKK